MPEKVPVTERALIQRINRKLREKGEILKTARGVAAKAEVGRFYVIHADRNILMYHHVGLEAWGKKLGVLQPWEDVEDPGC